MTPKFRAWDNKLNHYVKFGNGFTMGHGEWLRPMIVNTSGAGFFTLLTKFFYSGDRDIEYQLYSGLIVKDKIELCEGDIFALNDETYVVKYRSSCFMADNIKNGHEGSYGAEIWDTIVFHNLYDHANLIKHIGTVKENPEKLEVINVAS